MTNPASYYHELTDGFLSGHLYLPRSPDTRLVALPDPYDPVANEPYRVNDLSYHSGRYYFYPSAVPVLLLFGPVKIITGKHLSEPAADCVFALAGFGFAAAFLRNLKQRFFPESSTLLAVCAVAALALVQGYYVVLRVESYNHVPIACAHAWAMLSLLLLLRTMLVPAQSRVGWLAGASLAWALAIACRPNYVAGACVLLVPALMWWREDGWRLSRSWLNSMLAVALPMAAMAAALLAYNFARFGSPWEFGMRLQLGAWDQRVMSGLSLANLPTNAYHYLIGPGNYHWEFPFVTARSWTALGVIPHAPFVWSTLLLPWLFYRHLSPPARAALTLPLLVAAANLGFLMLFPSGNEQAVRTSANARYLFDFLPAWVLLGAGCIVATGAFVTHRPGGRALLGLATLLALAVSVLAALSLDFSRFPPEVYRPLARILSRPAWWRNAIRNVEYGPVELHLTFPERRIGAYEPLIATGSAEGGELLYVHYEAHGRIRLGLVSTEAPGPVSESIPVDFAQPHTLVCHLGSLYPADAHPLMAAFTEAQIAGLKRRLVVQLDGRTVLAAPAYFHPNEGGAMAIGRTAFLQSYAQERFTGTFLRIARQPVAPPADLDDRRPAYGALRLRITLPTDRAGVTEPLVATGIPQAGDLLHVAYRADGAIRLGIDHWGQRGLVSEWLFLESRSEHLIEFASGALFPPPNHELLAGLPQDKRLALKEQVHLRIDGRTVLSTRLPTYESSPYDVAIGRNAIGASSAVYAFSGRILEVSRALLETPPR